MNTVKERFDDKWIGEPNSGCWLWTSSVGQKGYGKFWYNGGCQSAHKISYFLHYNYYPTSKEHVLHKCDTPSCVNPQHLFLGDNYTNQRDCVAKGRHVAQNRERHHMQLLEKEQVLEIRKKLEKGSKGLDLAKEFNVSNVTISAIKTRRICKSV
jgi:hypothetical protein